MSSTSSPPPSSTSPSAPSASSSARGVDIPATTLISIGLGFVALTIVLVFVSVVVRIIRVQRRINASRPNGPRMTFRQAWHREGGLFGFMGSGGGDSLAFGAGGAGQLRLAELRRRQQEMWVTLTQVKARPVIWEVPVIEKGRVLQSEAADLAAEYNPFALFSSIPPRYIDRAKTADELPSPSMVMSTLIVMPMEEFEPAENATWAGGTHRVSTYDNEEWADLPELVIGTTEVWPMVQESEETDTRSISSKQDIGLSNGKPGKVMAEVQQLEYGTGGIRRARWTKFGPASWQIEGLG